MMERVAILLILFVGGGVNGFMTSVTNTRRPFAISRPRSLLQAATRTETPRLPQEALNKLDSQQYAIVENFIPQSLIQGLRNDVQTLRNGGRFKVAGVGQDSSNQIADNIRRAETCFIDNPSKNADLKSQDRAELYEVLSLVRTDLAQHSGKNLDSKLDELLYVYYPQGGYYKRHVDSVKNSPSYLRSFSFLLYLNDEEWDVSKQGGALRLHFDSGKDFLPDGESPKFLDVPPKGGTMVVFSSDRIPHEVLDTTSERLAVVGWYNRAMTTADIANITPAGGEDLTKRMALLAVAAGLVTVGVIQIVTAL